MNKPLKVAILIIALAIPVVIFLFLRMFGDNRFDIPLYYQSEQELPDHNCQKVKIPYKVDFTGLDLVNVKQKEITVFSVLSNLNESTLFQLARLNERLGSSYQHVVFVDSTNMFDSKLGDKVIKLDYDQIVNDWECLFLNKNLNQWVLVDEQQRIRGYYDTDEKEIDRLIVEIKILLENRK